MRRQGRQHGMVLTYPFGGTPHHPRPRQRKRIGLSSPPTAGIFTKVPSKPTNHSKFTGKCRRLECHVGQIHPACKSKDKFKGAQKVRSSSDVVSSHRLITWRVMDAAAAPGFKISGFSATSVLDYLASDDYVDHYYDDDDDDHDDSYDPHEKILSRGVEIEDVDDDDDDDDDNYDRMSFYEVGFVWGAVEGDESWCLVEEM